MIKMGYHLMIPGENTRRLWNIGKIFIILWLEIITNWGGKRTWDQSVPGEIWNYLATESVFVATEDGIFALERSFET